jgi:prepilin-type N-terminal cleavage/methylation domain-containing protein
MRLQGQRPDNLSPQLDSAPIQSVGPLVLRWLNQLFPSPLGWARQTSGPSVRNRSKTQRGYTFAEILVVTAIIGILVALLLPAVQACREAARRMSCAKNLEQLIIAVHNYEMLHQVYPPGTVNLTGPIQSLPQGYHHNWLIQLLPYLEQKNAYAHVDDLVGVYHANNMPVRRIDIETLTCPSAPRARRAYSDYAGVHNDIEAPIDVTNNGTFFLNSRVSYFDLKDGSSHTLFIGEKDTYAGDLGWMSGTRATLRNMGVPINSSHGVNLGRARRHLLRPSDYPPGLEMDDLPTESMLSDEETRIALFGQTDDYFSARNRSSGYGWGASDDDSEEKSPTTFKLPEDITLVVGGFGSEHPGGSQFAVGDGSVRFCSETIDPVTYQQLGHRADGQLVGEDW